MTSKNFLIFTIILLTECTADIIDYTREDYILIQNGNVLAYKNLGKLFHLTNLTNFQLMYQDTINLLKDNHEYVTFEKDPNSGDINLLEIDLEMHLIETLLAQLQPKFNRHKRGINEIGTLWKWIAGTPDHDDMMTVNDKINDLVQNNNQQFVINTQIFKAILEMNKVIKDLSKDNYAIRMIKQRNRLIITELQTVLQTLTLAKANILNSAILNLKEIEEIITHEHDKITLTDLMDVSPFKIIQTEDVIVIYIKYPIIENNCKLYETRAIAHNDGKLLISKEIAKCDKTFVNIKNCKLELTNNFCELSNEKSCLSEILNKKGGNCTKVKEKNTDIEIIKDGAIMLAGNHTVNSIKLNGVYLVTFEDETIIDNKTYENPNSIIWHYIKSNSVPNYSISEYLESDNTELKFKNLNMLQEHMLYIKENPLSSFLIIMLICISILYLLYKIILYYQYKSKEKNVRESERTLQEMNHRIASLIKEIETK